MRPSRFSRDYYKIMRRRRINIMLSILLIISILYFFGDRILGLVNINIKIPKIQISNPFEKKNIQEDKKTKQENNQTNQSPQTKEQTADIKKFSYNKIDGTVVEILIDSTTNKIVGIKDTGSKTNYMLAENKNFVVFDDVKAGKILLCDALGNIREISRDYYKSKSLKKTFYRKDILKVNPNYIWAAKPYITKDNRVIYISQLPYFKKDGEFHLWAYNLKTKETRRLGPLGTNKIDLIDYLGYSENTLSIKAEETNYKLDNEAYKLKK